MLHDIIKAYADALYVATTLRLPATAAPTRESECFADGEERGRVRSSGRLAGWVARLLQARLGRGFGQRARPARIRPSLIRAPHA